jgi:hypothetical protein
MKEDTPARAQTELPAIGIAFLFLTMTFVLGTHVANSALLSAERPAVEQQTAMGVSEQLRSEDAPLTTRANVLNATAVSTLDVETLSEQYGLPPDSDVRLRLDNEVIASTGSVTGGTTVERIVLIETRTTQRIEPALDGSSTVTLPRRTDNVRVELSPPENTTVRTLRVNDRVVRINESGLSGTFDLSLSPLETAQLRFEAIGELTGDDVDIVYYPPETEKATLAVTVDG